MIRIIKVKADLFSAKGRGTFIPKRLPTIVGIVKITVREVKRRIVLLRLLVKITW
jgi:hypothetical protein